MTGKTKSFSLDIFLSKKEIIRLGTKNCDEGRGQENTL